MKRFVFLSGLLIVVAVAIGSLDATPRHGSSLTPAPVTDSRHMNADGDGDAFLMRQLPGEVWPDAASDSTASPVAQSQAAAGLIPQIGGYGVDLLVNDPALDHPEGTTQS